MITSETFRQSRIPLADGAGAMPAVGFGTLIPDLGKTRQATGVALQVGFRHFDCAELYGYEEVVGDAFREALAAGTVARDDLFVTSKLWNTNHQPARVKSAFEGSCCRLQIDYMDRYLIHTPYVFAPGDDYDPRDYDGGVIYDPGVTLTDTWQAMERLVDEGRCRSIGLSNVSVEKLRETVAVARIKPAVV